MQIVASVYAVIEAVSEEPGSMIDTLITPIRFFHKKKSLDHLGSF